jgi:SnoaL-like domain
MPSIADDHAEIRNLIGSYCLTLDHDDVDGWLALFVPDATYQVYGHTFEGHDGLRTMLSGAPGGLHLGGPPVVELVGTDRAFARHNLLFVDRATGESRLAVYDDGLVRTDRGWRIATVHCRFLTATGLSDRPDP